MTAEHDPYLPGRSDRGYRFPDKRASHVCGTSYRTAVGPVVERAAVRSLASNARDAVELAEWLDMLGLTADAGKAAA